MEDLALERVETGNPGIRGAVELSRCGDECARLDDIAAGRLDLPQTTLLVERRATHLRIQADIGRQSVLGDAVQLVAMDVLLARVEARPVEVLFERKRIQRRRHVARRAWVSVVTPGATDLIRLLQ